MGTHFWGSKFQLNFNQTENMQELGRKSNPHTCDDVM